MFSIGFTSDALQYPYDDISIPAAPGCLCLGETVEEFVANFAIWGRADYESHWNHELTRLMKGSDKVALVVSYDDPKAASNMEIWRAYRKEDMAYLQNQLLPYDQLPANVKIAELSKYIQDRVSVNPEGKSISEWEIPIWDIESFLQR